MSNLDATHPWQSSVDHWNDIVMPRLKQHGKDIGHRANNGDKECAKLIGLYSMLTHSFDPMTAIMVEKLLDEVFPPRQ